MALEDSMECILAYRGLLSLCKSLKRHAIGRSSAFYAPSRMRWPRQRAAMSRLFYAHVYVLRC